MPYKPLLCHYKAGLAVVFYALGHKVKCATVVEPEEVSQIPNPLGAGGGRKHKKSPRGCSASSGPLSTR